MKEATEERCHCGLPLHYSSPHQREIVESLIRKYGACITVAVGARTFRVPRHFLALHGLQGANVPELGFEEIHPPAKRPALPRKRPFATFRGS